MFGDYPLGEFPIGDPGPTSDVPTVRARPAALFFNGTTRSFALDDDGHFLDTDTATAACQTALFLERNKIPSAPGVGQTFREVRDTTGPQAQANVDNRARTAIDHVVRRGDVRKVAVRMQPVASGMKVQVDAENRIAKEPVRVTT